MTVVPERMGLRAANGMERYIPSLSNDPTSLYRRSRGPINIDMKMSGYKRSTITVCQSNYSSRKIVVLVVYQALKCRVVISHVIDLPQINQPPKEIICSYTHIIFNFEIRRLCWEQT
ncbi:hypothetical protein V1477_003760 [Vespula maculifrons]